MPSRSITGGDVVGDHGTEVQGGGRLVLSDNLKSDIMPGVWSGNHRGVHYGPLPLHARN